MKQKLIELMEQKGVKTSDVAKATGVPKTTLYSFLQEDRGMNAETLAKVARYFGVPMEDFINDAT